MDDGPAPGAAGDGEREARTGRPSLDAPPDALLVAVPIGRAEELPGFVEAMLGCAAELARIDATVLFVHDASGDPDLAQAVAAAVEPLRGRVAAYAVDNGDETGFVAFANTALRMAQSTGRDALLLDPATRLRPGALAEMRAVACLDPLTSVVAPRSDDGGIGASPLAERLRARGGEAVYRAHVEIERHLPRASYTPTVPGSCVWIRRLALAEFGLLDPLFDGACAIDDFVRRANRRGYRALLANRAYADHDGESSTVRRSAEDVAALAERYPEHERAMQRHLASAERQAEHVLGGLVPVGGRIRLLFDARIMEPRFNGTMEHIRCLLAAFARRFSDRYDMAVLCGEEAYRFHGLHALAGLRRVDEAEALRDPAAIAFRPSQPDAASLATLCRLGAVTGALILDTIAMDCQQLDDGDLHRLWSIAASQFDLLGFNSAFTREQFGRRFAIPERTVQVVSLCSTDPADYAPAGPGDRRGGGIVVIGNEYPHKNVRDAIDALAAAGVTLPVTSFGVEVDSPVVRESYSAGGLAEDEVDRIYGEAAVALYPSHYEGFGLPIMHALARGVPVIARDLPSAREIKARCPVGRNLHLRASTAEMAALAAAPPAWDDTPPDPSPAPWNWDAAAGALADAFEEALRRFDFEACRRQQAAATTFAEASQTHGLHASIARLEGGIDLARRAIRRLDAEAVAGEARVAAAAEQERRAERARQDAEAAEAGERAGAQAATRRAEEAEARRLAERASRQVAEAAIEAERARVDEANRREEAATRRGDAAKAHGAETAALLAALAPLQPEAEAAELHRDALARWLDRLASRRWPQTGLDDPPPPNAALTAARLVVPPAIDERAEGRAALLRWSRGIAIGGEIEVRGMDRAAPLRRLLALAGFAVQWQEDRGGGPVLRAVRTRSWPEHLLVDGPRLADLGYLYWVGRAPDAGEREAVVRQLHEGAAPDAVMVTIAASDACWERWRPAPRTP